MLQNLKGHGQHPPGWQVGDICIVCVIEELKQSTLTTHRRLILSQFLHGLSRDERNPRTDFEQETSLVELFRQDISIATDLTKTLIHCLRAPEMDLAAEILAKLCTALNDDKYTEFITDSCIHTMRKEYPDAYDKWAGYVNTILKALESSPNLSKRFAVNHAGFLENLISCLGHCEATTLAALALLEFILGRTGGVQVLSLCKSLALKAGKLLKSASEKKVLLSTLELVGAISSGRDEANHFRAADSPGTASSLLYALKKTLLLSDSEIQMASLKVLSKILQNLNADEKGGKVLTVALQAGIAEELYEILSYRHLPSAELAVRCLYRLSFSAQFVEHRYAIFAVEPLIKAIPFLLESNAPALVTGCCAQLLSFIISKHEGNESLLSIVFIPGKADNAYLTVLALAVRSMENSSLPIRMGGASLLTTLLHKKHVPLPLPSKTIMQVLSALKKFVEYFAPRAKDKDWVCDAEAAGKILNAAVTLYMDCIKDPSVSLKSFNSKSPVNLEIEMDQILDQVLKISSDLLRSIPMVNDAPLWRTLLQLIIDTGRCSDKGSDFVQILVDQGFLNRCFLLRRLDAIKPALDKFLSWFLIVALEDEEKIKDLNQFASVVRQIPVSLERWQSWLQADFVGFGAKKVALIFLYLIEASQANRDRLFGVEHAAGLLNGISKMLMMSYTSDLHSKPVLRALWFIIAKYSSGPNEASELFCRLIKWFQTDPNSIKSWLAKIYTHHFCLVRWTFSSTEAAVMMAVPVMCLWMSQEGEEFALDELTALARTNHQLQQTLCDLISSQEIAVSSRASLVLERAMKNDELVMEKIWSALRQNVPSTLRSVSANNAFQENLARLNGLLRLLSQVINGTDTQQFIDPCIVSCLVAFLPNTVASWTDDVTDDVALQQLWSYGLRYIHAAMATSFQANDAKGMIRLTMEHEPFVTFIRRILNHMEWKPWNIAARIVVVIAEHEEKARHEGPWSFPISLAALITKLYGRAVDLYAEILQLIIWVVKGDLCRGLIYDQTLRDRQVGADERNLLDNLLVCLQNLSVQVEPRLEKLVYRCMVQVWRYVKRHADRWPIENALCQPWTYLCMLLTSQCHSASEFQELGRELKSVAANGSSSWKIHLWAEQVEMELLRPVAVPVETERDI